MAQGKKFLNSKEVKIRKISTTDLKRVEKFREYINSLIKEEAKILLNTKRSLKEEKEWLKSSLEEMEKHQKIVLVAEDKDKVVGISELKLQSEREKHIAGFGISIRAGYRGAGLGTRLMGEILKLAKKELKPTPKIIRLSVFANNKIATNLYEKMGFKKVARIPKQLVYKGKLIDEVVMLLEL